MKIEPNRLQQYMFIKQALILLFTLFSTISLYAQTEKCLNIEQSQTYIDAIEQNNGRSLYMLAFKYNYSCNDKKNALKWYRKASNQDYSEATYEIGMNYYRGLGVEQNTKEAFKWFLKSAKQLPIRSYMQIKVANMYYYGEGIEQNKEEAFKWYRKAAEHGNEEELQKALIKEKRYDEVKIYQTSFNCNLVKKNSIEYKICTNKKLSKLDQELSSVYKKLKKVIGKDNPQLVNDQKYFLQEREACNSTYCLKELYKKQTNLFKDLYKLYNYNNNLNQQQRINIDAFIHPNNTRKSVLLVNMLIETMNKSLMKYTKINNNYLFTSNSHRLSAGLYLANPKTGIVTRIMGGFSKNFYYMYDENILSIIFKSSGGRKGHGYEAIYFLNVDNYGKLLNQKKTIIGYDYDMLNGFCGRAFLKLKKSGSIDKIDLNIQDNLVEINVREQKCPNGEIKQKLLKYHLKKETFLD